MYKKICLIFVLNGMWILSYGEEFDDNINQIRSQHSAPEIMSLPYELHDLILSELQDPAISNVRLVNKYFNERVCEKANQTGASADKIYQDYICGECNVHLGALAKKLTVKRQKEVVEKIQLTDFPCDQLLKLNALFGVKFAQESEKKTKTASRNKKKILALLARVYDQYSKIALAYWNEHIQSHDGEEHIRILKNFVPLADVPPCLAQAICQKISIYNFKKSENSLTSEGHLNQSLRVLNMCMNNYLRTFPLENEVQNFQDIENVMHLILDKITTKFDPLLDSRPGFYNSRELYHDFLKKNHTLDPLQK